MIKPGDSTQVTWDQFKAHVDEVLAAEGMDGSAVIDYIDTSFVFLPKVVVHKDKRGFHVD